MALLFLSPIVLYKAYGEYCLASILTTMAVTNQPISELYSLFSIHLPLSIGIGFMFVFSSTLK